MEARIHEMQARIHELQAEMEEEHYHRYLFLSSPRIVVYVSAAHGWRMIMINPAACRSIASLADVVGVDPEKAVGAGADELFGTPELSPTALSQLRKPLSMLIQRGDRWIDLVANPVLTSDGRHIGSMVGWFDVTARQTSLDHIARAFNEVAAAIGQISTDAQLANETAREAASAAQDISERFLRLRESSTAVGTVVGVIDRVASQTHLLALNAHIEAARVGDAGRGFAVVATEVKDLARETGHATKDIRDRVGAIQAGTEDAGLVVGRIVETMNEISTRQDSIATAVEEQTTSTAELRRFIADVLG
jgi:hypothetical protein